jgi:hypothetical protein
MDEAGTDNEIRELVGLYASRVLAVRHRQVSLRGRKCHATIMRTLLGYEVKAGRKRIGCPDLITARYLRVFAEIGLATVRVPYDPTKTRGMINVLEAKLEQIRKTASQAPDSCRKAYRKLRRQLLRAEQEELRGTLVSRGSP